jgi:uncharacterized OsmC-like protein
MDLRSVQKPFKDQYRQDPASSRITLRAQGAPAGSPMACSVDIGRAIYAAEAHRGVGGPGTGACSGDLLLGALAACAQITCQLVATALGIEFEKIEAAVEGDLDLRGTLGVSKDVPVGVERHTRAPRRLCARRHRRAAANAEREDRAVLRRPADADESPGDPGGLEPDIVRRDALPGPGR